MTRTTTGRPYRGRAVALRGLVPSHTFRLLPSLETPTPSRMAQDTPQPPERRTPAKGVRIALGEPNWVFLTVCAEGRERWLADANVHSTLHHVWEREATAWLVSDYLLMPDHLHLFCAPRDFQFTIERWIGWWKERFAKASGRSGGFQKGGFHHRLRSAESYAEKWRYVQENPIRAGLVTRSEDWLYQGRVHEIHW